MDSKNFRIRRIIYILLIVLSLIFISFCGGTLPYMIVFALIINMIASVIYMIYIFYSLRINQDIMQHVVNKNEYVKLQFKIGNEGLLAGTSIRLNFNHEFSEVSGCEELSHIGLEPREYIVRELELLCRYSGTYYAGVDSIEITDYFGIFHKKFEMPQRMKVVVRPRVLKIDNLGFLKDNEKPVNSSNLRQDEAVVDNETRLYQNGDNVSMIHWRNSMKMQKLFVRTMSAEESFDYIVVIDEQIQSKEYADRIITADRIREAAIAIINYMYTCGYSIGCAMEKTGVMMINDQYELEQLYNKISGCNFIGRDGANASIDGIISGTAYENAEYKNLNYQGSLRTTIIVVSSNKEKNVNSDSYSYKSVNDNVDNNADNNVGYGQSLSWKADADNNIVWLNVNDYESVEEMFSIKD